MSRIGNAPVEIKEQVTIDISEDNVVTVKGPKGELKQKIDDHLEVKVEDGELRISRTSDEPQVRALHGLSRALLYNMVHGVTEEFSKELELVGVGYRAKNTGNLLELALGYSHPIYFSIPEEITVATEMEKGKNPRVILKSPDKQLVGQIAAKIRSFRKPEPYKGKGVRYVDEYIRRKAGKTAAKA